MIVESADAKCADMKDGLCLLKNKSMYKWTHIIWTCVVQGSTGYTYMYTCLKARPVQRLDHLPKQKQQEVSAEGSL